MGSRLVYSVVFGTTGFISCLLVQKLLALRHEGLEAAVCKGGTITSDDSTSHGDVVRRHPPPVV